MKLKEQDRNGAGAHRRARAWTGTLALAVSALCAVLAAPVHAGPNDGPPRRDEQRDGHSQQQAQQPQQQQPQQQRDSRWGNATDARSFEARAEEQRRILQESANNAEMTRRMSRMTPDEKAELRRQINNAGQEVYSVPRR